MSVKTKTVGSRKCMKVLREVEEAFGMKPDEEGGPVLVMAWDWLGTGAAPAIVWEEGPYEWALLASGGGMSEFGTVHQPIEEPEGVFLEPVTSWALGIYPA